MVKNKKMKQFRISLSILLLAFLTTNCAYAQKKKGDGNVVKQERQVGTFNELELSGVFNVEISQGEKELVVVETDQNLQEYIETNNENGRLVIKTEKGVSIKKSTKLNVYVTVADINYLEISGVGNISCLDKLILSSLNLEISGVGNTSLALDCEILNAENSSVGNIELVGEIETAFIENSGVGNLNAFELIVQNLTFENSGVGKAKVYAAQELSIENSGIGNLFYKGNANIKKFESSGIGKIKRVED